MAAGLRSLVKGAWRTMAAVFKQAGVKQAHPHRFRHTLASELLGKGGKLEVVAVSLEKNRRLSSAAPHVADRVS